MTTFTVGDTGPNLTGTLTSSDGAAVNLTSASLEVRIQRPGAGATLLAAAAIVSPTEGTWSYAWQTGDLDTSGTWEVSVVVTFGSGQVQTFGPATFTVQAQLT
jgi:hypothetical protein